jgi:hypothetical protein
MFSKPTYKKGGTNYNKPSKTSKKDANMVYGMSSILKKAKAKTNKSFGQVGMVKPVYSTDRFRVQNYQDSADLYNFHNSMRPPTIPQVDKNKYNEIRNKHLDLPNWMFATEEYKEDEKNKRLKNFEDYAYSVPYRAFEEQTLYKNPRLMRNSPYFYDRSNTENKYSTILPDGRIKMPTNLNSDGSPNTVSYRVKDRAGNTTRDYWGTGKLYDITSSKIKPIETRYYAQDTPNIMENFSEIRYKVDSKGRKIGKGEKVRTWNSEFYPTATREIYKKPFQPYIYADPEIVEKQKKLKDAGLYLGELDGIWGKDSKKAWKTYEEGVASGKITTTPTSTATAATTSPTPPVVRKPVVYTAPTKVQPKTTQTSSDTPWRFMLGNDSYQTFDEETAKTFAKDLGITNLQRGDNKNIDSATGKYRDYSSLTSSPTTNTGTTGQITKYPKLKRMAFGGTVKSAPRLAKIYKASKLRK